MSFNTSVRDLAEVDAVVPLTVATINRARRYVKRQAHDEVDERELLDALGLLP